jgi:hypothetical protein
LRTLPDRPNHNDEGGWIASEKDMALDAFPNLLRWTDAIRRRPATQFVYKRGDEIHPPGQKFSEEARKHLFDRGKAA